MTCHQVATKGSFDIIKGNSIDIKLPLDGGTRKKNVLMSMDVYTPLAEPIYSDGDLFSPKVIHRWLSVVFTSVQSGLNNCCQRDGCHQRHPRWTQGGQTGMTVWTLRRILSDAFSPCYTPRTPTPQVSSGPKPSVGRQNQLNLGLRPGPCAVNQSVVPYEITDCIQPKTEELGMLLSSAITFKAEEKVLKLTKFAAQHLPVEFCEVWRKNKNHEGLHENRYLMAKLFTLVSESIHSLGGALDSRSQLPQALSILWSTTPRHCHEVALCPELCSKPHRVSEYLKILAVQSLWPHSMLRKDNASVSLIVQRVSDMSLDIPHHCEGGLKCPLLVHINSRLSKVKRVVDDFIPGVEQAGKQKGECNGCGSLEIRWRTATKMSLAETSTML
ncbi:hypothetical protein CI238_07877 [Colletotrichum incanum]|uniref:Uncharacterized protein n=1 Tax=Colletotrichum incanum TaxID=1573173 RepID=A0A167E523_COLIC|nr:hypothetical protein CI238_07877 [Colletotrichum incanum]